MNSSFRYLGYVETNKLLKTTLSILCILPLYKDAVSVFFNNWSLLEFLSLNINLKIRLFNVSSFSRFLEPQKMGYKRAILKVW